MQILWQVGHGASPVESVRKASCPAWSATCHKCERKGHFKEEAEVNTIAAKGGSAKYN